MEASKSNTKSADADTSETDIDALFASPSQTGEHDDQEPLDELTHPNTANLPANTRQVGGRFDAEEARQATLQAELEGVRNINRVIEGVVSSLDRAKQNMEVCIDMEPFALFYDTNGFSFQMVSRTVTSASTLLNTWTRILSQTEHNQRLILNPAWQGASRDIADLENESLLRQQAAERRELEEQQRREAAARKAEEDQEQRRRAESSAGRGNRGLKTRGGRGVGRGASMTGSTSRGVRGQTMRGVGRGGSTSTRGSSTTGRETTTSTRGRGRANR